jgi:cytolysin-activating lysine-acyltransferase
LLKIPQQERYKLLGEITSILLASDLHRKYQINDIGAVFLPPIHLNQFRIYKNKAGDPIGMVTWAFFSKEIEKKYLSKKYFLKPEDWQSGDYLWFIDFAAPFGHTKKILKDLTTNIFPDRHARSVRMMPDGKVKTTYDWYGVNYLKEKRDKQNGKKDENILYINDDVAV